MSITKFDPTAFTAPTAKPLPVIFLLDVSASMSGSKIRNLNEAVKDMLGTFSQTETSETEIHVAIITFGADVSLNQPLTSASQIQWHDLSASGMTPLGTALKMAKAMIEDKDVVPSRAYRPTVVLVSDGQPNDEWQQPLTEFISAGRSAKCDRMAMAIGADADERVLAKFTEGTEHPLFYSENAKQMREFFKFVTMSVTSRVHSGNPNVLPEPKAIEAETVKIEARSVKPDASETQKKLDEAGSEDHSEEGYW